MINKEIAKKINRWIGHITGIIMMCLIIGYFFIDKNLLNGLSVIIIWAFVGLNNVCRLIDDKYFSGNFTWRNNFFNVIVVITAIIVVIARIVSFK